MPNGSNQAMVGLQVQQAQQAQSGAMMAGFGAFYLIVWFAMLVLVVGGMWKMFTKAGKPGWASLIPFYNIYVLLEIVGRPGWWLVLYFIPFVNFIISLIVMNDTSKAFGRGIGTTLGLIFFPYIFIPILGFGAATYTKPAVTA